MIKLLKSTDGAVATLRARMDRFYGEFPDYFQRPSEMGHFWPYLLPVIEEACAKRGRCRVLEFGAGRTGFSQILIKAGLRRKVDFSVQDVTTKNRAWLEHEADTIYIGPVERVAGEYDLIFSSFVLEHMTDPEAALDHLWRRIAPGGTLSLVCPRYDMPFYLPPSCDHLGVASRIWLALRLIGWRLRTLMTRKPGFLLLNDLAMFHLPWTRDRDAVHLASLYDFTAFFSERGGRVVRLRSLWRGGLGDWRDWVIKRYLQILVKVVHEPGA